jgi:hypothetical protein
MIIRLVDHPEEGTDISPETLAFCQRMTPGNNPKSFIHDNNHGESHTSPLVRAELSVQVLIR